MMLDSIQKLTFKRNFTPKKRQISAKHVLYLEIATLFFNHSNELALLPAVEVTDDEKSEYKAVNIHDSMPENFDYCVVTATDCNINQTHIAPVALAESDQLLSKVWKLEVLMKQKTTHLASKKAVARNIIFV